MKACIACGAEEQRTRRSGQVVATSIDPISGLCIACLPKRAAAAPAGSLFDRINALDTTTDVPRGTPSTTAMTARTHRDQENR